MRRLKCLIAVGGLAAVLLTAGFLAAAQPPSSVRRIGYLTQTSGAGAGYQSFRQELGKLGYVEGKNIEIEYGSANTKPRIEALATRFIQQKLEVLVTIGIETTQVVQKTTKTVPIVFAFGGDPIEGGLVKSLARPSGNLTGISWMTFELGAKQLELLKEAVPRISRVAVLLDLKFPGKKRELTETLRTMGDLGVILEFHRVRDKIEYDIVFDDILTGRDNALLVFPSPRTMEHRHQIANFAIKHRLPSMFGWREYAEAGGLISYGPNRAEALRRVAVCVDKILKGTKPGDLPVEQPTKFELVINLKTAKALGLKIPPHLLMEADKVIE